jgi:hypothetical protein
MSRFLTDPNDKTKTEKTINHESTKGRKHERRDIFSRRKRLLWSAELRGKGGMWKFPSEVLFRSSGAESRAAAEFCKAEVGDKKSSKLNSSYFRVFVIELFLWALDFI